MPKAFKKRHRSKAADNQNLARRGKDGVVTMRNEQFDRLVARARQPKSLVQFFRESPLVGVELEFERDNDKVRDIELGMAISSLPRNCPTVMFSVERPSGLP